MNKGQRVLFCTELLSLCSFHFDFLPDFRISFHDRFYSIHISATNTRHREGFKTMVADALAGKIDLIITKSVSRFARNTVDSLTTVRKLKDNGIEIYFEKDKVIADSEFARQFLTDTADLEKEQTELEQEMAVLVEMTQNAVAENARVALDQKEYQERYNGLVDRYDRAKARYEEVTDAIAVKKTRYKALGTFIDRLREQDAVTRFDAGLWGSMVKFMTVYSNKDIRVIFQNDVEVKAE